MVSYLDGGKVEEAPHSALEAKRVMRTANRDFGIISREAIIEVLRMEKIAGGRCCPVRR